MKKSQTRYHQLIEKIFFDKYQEGVTEIPFERSALNEAAKSLGIDLPQNPGAPVKPAASVLHVMT
jgi:hypothetical protein